MSENTSNTSEADTSLLAQLKQTVAESYARTLAAGSLILAEVSETDAASIMAGMARASQAFYNTAVASGICTVLGVEEPDIMPIAVAGGAAQFMAETTYPATLELVAHIADGWALAARRDGNDRMAILQQTGLELKALLMCDFALWAADVTIAASCRCWEPREPGRPAELTDIWLCAIEKKVRLKTHLDEALKLCVDAASEQNDWAEFRREVGSIDDLAPAYRGIAPRWLQSA